VTFTRVRSGSFTTISVANLTQKVDTFFDRLDNAIESVDRVVNRSQNTTAKLGGETKAQSAKPSSSTAIARARVYRTIESVDGETGHPVFIVTDGNDRCECSSRELAERVCRSLNPEKR
jgi:hypothetical protein